MRPRMCHTFATRSHRVVSLADCLATVICRTIVVLYLVLYVLQVNHSPTSEPLYKQGVSYLRC